MKKQITYRFGKLLRKYRNVQKRLFEASDQDLIRHLHRKLDLLGKRLVSLNRRWKMGIAMTALLAWMGSSVQAQTFSPVFNVTSLNGTNGIIITGKADGDYSGFSVSSVGDINGDGTEDFAIGAPGTELGPIESAGGAYIIFGNDAGLPSPFDPASIDGSNGFFLQGDEEYSFAGVAISRAGDINKDGMDDLIIGASGATPNDSSYAGKAYVLFGSNKGFPDTLGLGTLNGSNGFAMHGITAFADAGSAVSNVGDINGDGIDDIIVGARYATQDTLLDVGEAYVVFGRNGGFTSPIEFSSLNGIDGFTILGESEDAYTGTSVSSAGDINGDGMMDIMIGAPNALSDTTHTGAVYVVFGRNTGFPSEFHLSSLDGTNGFKIPGLRKDDYTGASVSFIGDFNKDGMDDIIIGAPSASVISPDGHSGEVYVIFGNNTGFAHPFDLTTLDGTNGFAIQGQNDYDYCGNSVSGAGDVNGDGIDDIIFGAPTASPNGNVHAGETYVVFGTETILSSGFSLANIDGNNGFAIQGSTAYDYSGISVSGAGDVNGDGASDVIFGGLGAARNGMNDVGESYVVFGKPDTTNNTGIHDLAKALPLSVAPNPVQNVLYISSESFHQTKFVDIRLYDPAGREISVPQLRESSNRYQLDLGALSKGVYFLRVSNDGRVANQRVIKQ